MNCAGNFMNLSTVIDISRQEFADRMYDKMEKVEIVMRFMRDELGFTLINFQELYNAGSTLANNSPIEGDNAGRFFLWYYINYMADQIPEES